MSDEEKIFHVEQRRLTAKAAYMKSKVDREHVLLRLRHGSLARIDQARANLGLNRSAYIERLLDAALPPRPAPTAASTTTVTQTTSIGDEFYALFGGGA